MKVNLFNQYNNQIQNPAFKNNKIGSKLLALMTMDVKEIQSKCTQGHFDNIFFKTNLNDVLRHPEAQFWDELQYMAISKMPNSFNGGIGQYYRKIPIKENPNLLKEKLNAEFRLLPELKKTQQFYRGIENVSEKEYQIFANYRKGEIVTPDKGYAYITRTLNDANLYNKGKNGILFEMEFPEGSQISELQAIMPPRTKGSMFCEIKDEAVVPAGSLYEVTQNSCVDKDGILHVHLRFLNKWK